MSSFATAPKRTADKDPKTGKQQLHLLTNPDEVAEPEPEAPPPEPAAAPASSSAQTLDEVSRVERLLSQLEARSLALVPYGYGSLREVSTRKSRSGLLASSLVALWLATLVLGVAYIRFVGHSPVVPDRAAGTVPLVITPQPDPQEQKVANSVDHLAKALVSSSERMNELQAAMERSNRDLQRIATKVTSDHAKAVSTPAKTEDEQYAATQNAVAEGSNLPRNWHRVLEVKPTEAAVAHKASDGTIDYWLVPRSGEATPSKVLPIGTSAEGVVVHNLDDGKDYTLTPSGEWRNGALASGGN